jgi:hypothetical protein
VPGGEPLYNVAALSSGSGRLPRTSQRVAALSAGVYSTQISEHVGRNACWAKRHAVRFREELPQRNVLSVASMQWKLRLRPIKLLHVETFAGAARCQPIELPHCKAAPLQAPVAPRYRRVNRSIICCYNDDCEGHLHATPHQISFSPRNRCRTTFVNVPLLI